MTATWSTPSDFAASHIVTATEWNTLQGASGDMMFLYNSLLTVSSASTANALNTIYQNATGRIRMVNVVGNGTPMLLGYIGSTSPPVTLTANVQGFATNATLTLIVPPQFYYTVSSAAGALVMWYEWNFHAT